MQRCSATTIKTITSPSSSSLLSLPTTETLQIYLVWPRQNITYHRQDIKWNKSSMKTTVWILDASKTSKQTGQTWRDQHQSAIWLPNCSTKHGPLSPISLAEQLPLPPTTHRQHRPATIDVTDRSGFDSMWDTYKAPASVRTNTRQLPTTLQQHSDYSNLPTRLSEDTPAQRNSDVKLTHWHNSISTSNWHTGTTALRRQIDTPFRHLIDHSWKRPPGRLQNNCIRDDTISPRFPPGAAT